MNLAGEHGAAVFPDECRKMTGAAGAASSPDQDPTVPEPWPPPSDRTEALVELVFRPSPDRGGGANSTRRRRLCGAADGVECGDGGVGEVRQRVEIPFGGPRTRVSEAFTDGFHIGAAGQQPGGVGVAQVVHAHPAADTGLC